MVSYYFALGARRYHVLAPSAQIAARSVLARNIGSNLVLREITEEEHRSREFDGNRDDVGISYTMTPEKIAILERFHPDQVPEKCGCGCALPNTHT